MSVSASIPVVLVIIINRVCAAGNRYPLRSRAGVVHWAAANGDAALETRGPVVREVWSRDGLAVR